jgi:colanic acid biosynthesis glycosyl transferase WcaI
VGGGVDRAKLEKMAEEMKLDNVRFMPRQPMHAMGSILAGADVLLVHLKDDPLFRITIPSKTQAYLAAGKPILMGVRGDAADLGEASHSPASSANRVIPKALLMR